MELLFCCWQVETGDFDDSLKPPIGCCLVTSVMIGCCQVPKTRGLFSPNRNGETAKFIDGDDVAVLHGGEASFDLLVMLNHLGQPTR